MTRLTMTLLVCSLAANANATTETTGDHAWPLKASDGEFISFQGDRLSEKEADGICLDGPTVSGTYWDPSGDWYGLPPESHFGDGPAPSHGIIEEIIKWVKEAGAGYKNCAGQAQLAFETCAVAADDGVEIACCDLVKENWLEMCWSGEVAVDSIPIDHFENQCVMDDDGERPEGEEPEQPEVGGAAFCEGSASIESVPVVFFDPSLGGVSVCSYTGDQRIVPGRDGQHCSVEYDVSGMHDCEQVELDSDMCW